MTDRGEGRRVVAALSRARRALAAAFALAFAATSARAQDGLPWMGEGGVPLSSEVQSVVIPKDDLLLYTSPRPDAPRRGSVKLGARLPLYSAIEGPGCAGRWLMIGPLAWVCRAQVELSGEPPLPWISPRDVRSDGLPFSYWFVGKGGSAAYGRFEFADDAEPEEDLQPGFGVAIVEQRSKGGEPYGRTHHGLWVPVRDLIPVRPFAFHGEDIANGDLSIAWVLDDRTPVFTKPDGVTRGKATMARFQTVRVLEESGKGDRLMLRVGDGEWLRAKDVRRPQRAARPVEAMRGERWLDVELSSQTLVAYEGDVPVFATLVSTGRGAEGSPTATPKGVHRIWVKLESSTMGNLDDENASSTYEIEDVPWVQFFSKGVALHGAFWHHGFGRVHSHGCVNLSPLDAERIFRFTGPRVPAGWSAALPIEFDLGTIVRVR